MNDIYDWIVSLIDKSCVIEIHSKIIRINIHLFDYKLTSGKKSQSVINLRVHDRRSQNWKGRSVNVTRISQNTKKNGRKLWCFGSLDPDLKRASKFSFFSRPSYDYSHCPDQVVVYWLRSRTWLASISDSNWTEI